MIDNCHFHIKRRLNEPDWSSLNTSLVIWIQLSIWQSNESYNEQNCHPKLQKRTKAGITGMHSFQKPTITAICIFTANLKSVRKGMIFKPLRATTDPGNDDQSQWWTKGKLKQASPTSPGSRKLRQDWCWETQYTTRHNAVILISRIIERDLSPMNRRTWIGSHYQT